MPRRPAPGVASTALRIAALACLLGAAGGRAGEPDRRLGAPPQADPSPTGYACTVDTLISGAACVFEGDPAAPPDSGATARSLEGARRAMCAAAARPPGEARPDAGVRSACEADVARSLGRCADGRALLLDRDGRFLPSARACYAALGNALSLARTLAATLAPCCRCLAEARCGSARACVRGGLRRFLSGAEATCAARACGAECGPYLAPPDDVKDSEDAPPKASPARPAPPDLGAHGSTKDT